MRLLIASLFVLFTLAGRTEAMPRDWRDVDLGQAVIEGVADREHIWLRGSTRKVVRFVRATGERTVIAEDVVDLLSDNGRLWLLGSEAERTFTTWWTCWTRSVQPAWAPHNGAGTASFTRVSNMRGRFLA